MKKCISFTRKIDWLPIYYDHGWGNGYVGVPKGHPWYGKDYDEIEVSIHGGLTFGKFDEDLGMWVVGFDCAHAGDDIITCSKEYVELETADLLAQAEAAAKKYNSIWRRIWRAYVKFFTGKN